MKPPQIMINWEERQIFCESCNTWINAWDLRIDGRHDMPNVDGKSTHRVWERD